MCDETTPHWQHNLKELKMNSNPLPQFCVYVVKYNGIPVYVGRTTWALSDRLNVSMNKSRSRPDKVPFYNFVSEELKKDPTNVFKFTIQRFSSKECSERHAYDYYTKLGYTLYQHRKATTTELCANGLPQYSPTACQHKHLQEKDWMTPIEARVKMSESARNVWAKLTPAERTARAKKAAKTRAIQRTIPA